MNFYDDQERDQILVEKAKSGDSTSFNVLVEKYHPIAWALAYQWVKNPTDTQDILQTAYLQAFQKLSQLKDTRKFFGWLRQIIVNVCKIYKRSQDHYLDIGNHTLDTPQLAIKNQVQALIETQETNHQLNQILDNLPNNQAFLIRLFYFGGYSYQQIASLLDLPITTIESRLYKARQNLNQPRVRTLLEELLQAPLHILDKGRFTMPKIEVVFGESFIQHFKNENSKDLILSQISNLRRTFAQENQLQIPPIRLKDDVELNENTFQIHIDEEVVYQCEEQQPNDPNIFSKSLEETILKYTHKF